MDLNKMILSTILSISIITSCKNNEKKELVVNDQEISNGIVIDSLVVDLNNDDIADKVLITERDQNRNISVYIKENNSLKLISSNDEIIGCATCGHQSGDPYITLEKNTEGFNLNLEFENLYFYYKANDIYLKKASLLKTEQTEEGIIETNKIYDEKQLGSINLSNLKNNFLSKHNLLKKTDDSDNISTENKIVDKITLPFDFEKYKSLCSENTSECKNKYPYKIGSQMPDIKKLIINKGLLNPETIFKIDNGNLNFDTYIFESVADAESQTIINVKNNMIISNENIGYSAAGEDATYETFLLDENLILYIYEKNYSSGKQKLLVKYKITEEGKITVLK